MGTSHERVLALRAVVLGGIRLAALAMVSVGIVMVTNRLLYAWLGTGEISSSWRVFNRIGETHGIYLGLPLMAVGIALGLLSERIARWVVRPPVRGCPRCGYETLDEAGRCSECGYT